MRDDFSVDDPFPHANQIVDGRAISGPAKGTLDDDLPQIFPANSSGGW